MRTNFVCFRLLCDALHNKAENGARLRASVSSRGHDIQGDIEKLSFVP